MSDVFTNICDILGIRKTRRVVYNPKSDGMVERFNRTLLDTVLVTQRLVNGTGIDKGICDLCLLLSASQAGDDTHGDKGGTG